MVQILKIVAQPLYIAAVTRYLLIIYACWLCLCTGCADDYDAPCRSTAFDNRLLSTSQRQLWPFFTTDTLRFINATSDTLLAIAAPLQSGYISRAKPNNPECPDDSIRYEKHRRHYTASAFDWVTGISVYEQHIDFIHSGDTFVMNWDFLSHPDSAAFETLELDSQTFTRVYVRTKGNDSLYYNSDRGIIRFKSYTRIP